MSKSQTEEKKELKFRAWDIEKGEMLTPDMSDWYINFECSDTIVFCNNMNFTEQEDHFNEIGKVEIMQYTGLKDKNGKDIYEGDIVEQRNSITGITNYYEIVWSNDDCGFIGKGEKDSLFNGLGIISKELEIIGNIYEK